MMRVLVVEDEEMIRKGIVLATDWQSLGCVVVGEAANGEEGIAQAEKCRPSLIITDLKMPKMDGLEMIAKLREAGCDAYIIILTAYDSFTYAQTALRLGAVDFLLKPFHDGDLENAVLALQKKLSSRKKEPEAQLPAIRAGAKSRYVQEADACVQDILSRGKPVILVGGTGLYIDSLIAGRQFAPLPQTGRREALERRAAEEGAQPLLDELRAVDPERAARLSVSDVKRIVRALEIWQETGRTMTDFDRESRAIPPRYRPLWLGLHFPERAQLYARIDLRVELMYAQGLAQEVRALLDSGVPDRATSLQAIGYKQVVQALEEGLPPEAALGTIQQATRRYAKRQMTWFRANPAVQWLDASAGADEIFRAALQKAADFDSGI